MPGYAHNRKKFGFDGLSSPCENKEPVKSKYPFRADSQSISLSQICDEFLGKSNVFNLSFENFDFEQDDNPYVNDIEESQVEEVVEFIEKFRWIPSFFTICKKGEDVIRILENKMLPILMSVFFHLKKKGDDKKLKRLNYLTGCMTFTLVTINKHEIVDEVVKDIERVGELWQNGFKKQTYKLTQ